MAGWHHDNARWKEKRCEECGNRFTPTGPNVKYCSPQCKRWAHNRGANSTRSQYRRITGNWKLYFNRLLHLDERRAGLTVDNLMGLLEQQQGLCALSGAPMTCMLVRGTTVMTNASIDRKVPGGPYTLDNIQLVCRAVNNFRASLPIDEYIEWCRKVAGWAGSQRAAA